MAAVAPIMRDQGAGSIVNISSVSGMRGHGSIAYVGSKWAVRGMTKSAAHELGRYGVRVNSVHPGAIATDMLLGRGEDTVERWTTGVPLGRPGRAEEVRRRRDVPAQRRVQLRERRRDRGGWRVDRPLTERRVMDEARDVDVIVVGSGVAGLAAALTARERGAASVLVAESEGVVGGSSRLSGGLMMGAGTRYQKALGIDDDPDSLFHDYLQLNRWNVDAGVVRRFCELAGPTVEWVGDLGVEYYDTLVFGGEERVPRVHVPIGRGQAVVDVLARHCREAEVDVALGQRVDRLLIDVRRGRRGRRR